MNKVILILSIIFTSGCTGLAMQNMFPGGEKFSGVQPPDDGMAVIYLFRSRGLDASAAAPKVSINEGASFLLRNGTYHRFELLPGLYSFQVEEGIDYAVWWRWEKHGIDINLSEGNEYYIHYRVDSKREGRWTYTIFSFNEINKYEAINKLKDLKQADSSEISSLFCGWLCRKLRE